MLLSCLLGVHFWVSYRLRHEYIVSLYDIARLAQFVRFVILSQHFFFMVAVAACMINLVGKAGSTQDCEELQSRRSVESDTCQTVRKSNEVAPVNMAKFDELYLVGYPITS